MTSKPMTVREVVKHLLIFKKDVQMYQRALRTQGHSKYLAVSKIVPKTFKTVRMYKVAEEENAVLLLFIDPTKKGYRIDTEKEGCTD